MPSCVAMDPSAFVVAHQLNMNWYAYGVSLETRRPDRKLLLQSMIVVCFFIKFNVNDLNLYNSSNQ